MKICHIDFELINDLAETLIQFLLLIKTELMYYLFCWDSSLTFFIDKNRNFIKFYLFMLHLKNFVINSSMFARNNW